MFKFFTALAIAVALALPASAAPAGHVTVVATFSTLASLVSAVGGDGVSVTSLVPVGASPEDYQPTPSDIRTLHDAQLLVENGGGIESWLDRTVASARNPAMRTLTLSTGLPMQDGNPHLWMDPVLAQKYVTRIAAALSTADPAGRQGYEKRARGFNAQLESLRHEIAKQIATIPPDHRTMIVFHNAWQYYNDRFGIKTIGVIELSPGQEPSPRYIADLVRMAKAQHVRAVFAEPEYSPKLVHALADSAGISTVENLYDDSLSTSSDVHDYPSMLRYDTKTIVKALR